MDVSEQKCQDRTVGVLGGMGPAATVNFMQEVIDATPADRDEDHIEMVVYNDPKIPDRNQAILDGTRSPLPRLKRNARRLASINVDYIAIPCNTVHYYYDGIADSVDVNVLNMIEIVRNQLEVDGMTEVGLLATSTVIEVDLYTTYFQDSDIKIRYPTDTNILMQAIYAVKRGNTDKAERLVDDVLETFIKNGISTVVIGCTDLSTLSFPNSVTTLDTTKILAERCVELA